jgi:hypothetical protein
LVGAPAVEGAGVRVRRVFGAPQAPLLDPFLLLGDGDEVGVDAGEDGARFLLVAGRPLGEPIAWWGPIVMSSEEELRAAISDYHNGTFVRHRG